MKIYKGNSNYRLFDSIFGLVFSILILFILINQIENEIYLILSILVVFVLNVIIVQYHLRNLLQVVFGERNILVKYKFRNPKSIEIEYKQLKKITLYHAQGYGRQISLRYFDKNQKVKKINISSVASNKDFISFVEFVKNNNSDVDFEFLIPLSGLESKYQKLYPTKYRKILKETL